DGDWGKALEASINSPLYIARDSVGFVYLTDNMGQYIRVLYKRGGNIEIDRVAGTGTAGFSGENVKALESKVNRPAGLAFDKNNNLYVSDSGNARVRMISAYNGVFYTKAGGGSGGLGYIGPALNATLSVNLGGVAFDGSGNMYFADTGDHRVRRVRADNGNIETIAGTGVAGFTGDGTLATGAALNSPSDVAIDSAGDLYIADTGNSRIRKVNMITGIISTVAGGGLSLGDGKTATEAQLNGPRGIMISGGYLYISDTGHHRIRRMSLETNVIVTVAGVGVAGFSGDGWSPTAAKIDSPVGLMAVGDGRILFCDTGNNRVRAFVPETGNRAPVALDDEYDIPADAPFTFVIPGTDPDGDAISYSVLGNPVHGALSGLNEATGQITYTPPPAFHGTDSFTFQVSDGTLKSYFGLVILRVGSSEDTEFLQPRSVKFTLRFNKPMADSFSLSARAEGLNFTGTSLEGKPITAMEVTVGGGASAWYSGEVVPLKNIYKTENWSLSVKTSTGALKFKMKKLDLSETLGYYGATNETTDEYKYLTVPVSFVFRVGTETIRANAWLPVFYKARLDRYGKGRQY
ncbi:MAG: Ig-like domain-containing protein, partial [Planctomycetota bacterium]|nr:Ig-like domain-containing protein [Planctomycetota bacterium]